ncbi:iron ABC transporter permease [Leucobacter luti]|uniref:Iron complex transport system permease protein n=1 Tax=Leucobacter luti TaxID=340320 RepID=A0A4V3CYV1_9MICO|nr:iron ABC transporter permease [Leucobacter luti]MCW2288785.1 iron complex transport system permease protein [Leucobacter luti]QYM75309.1 iron ABC transporter permease [Leucobacter luti]TCK45063.1 iron complex transport system permease protein [Leucobacter luti]TDP95588.1 iron complex transport system permease protein [Leucobacter luti]
MTTSHRTASRHAAKTTILFSALGIALIASVLISAGTGQLGIPPQEVLGSLLHRIGIDWLPMPSHPAGDQTLWAIRFPRVAMAALVGAGLAVSGLLMQAIFGNPLAEPGVIGISSGAAVGAGLAIVFGLTIFGEWTTAVFAFIFGLGATLVVYGMSRAEGKTEVVTLVLTGVAVNAMGGAGIALLTFLGDTQSREQIVFWQLGSLAGSRWSQVLIIAPIIAVGLIAAYIAARKLDLLSLGERNARHLGVNVELLRIVMIFVVALLVGAAVAFAGIIAFVGLVIPHLMRMLLGPAHLPLVTASALGGALLLTLADLAARTLVPMADMPIGMLTALVGGPFFFWLLRRTRKRSGGWG